MASSSDIAAQALAHHRRGEIEQAIALYRQVLKKHPTNLNVLSNLAMALQTRGDSTEAVSVARAALKIDADHLAAMKTLSTALRAVGKHDDSITVWREAIARRPMSIEPRIELARTLTLLRRIEQAIDAWREAALLDASHVDARIEAARLLLRLGKREEARQLIVDALRIAPEDGGANVLMAGIERRAGDIAHARERLERVMAGGDALATGRASLELATILEQAGEFERAFAAAEHGQAALRSRLSNEALNLAPALTVIESCRQHISADAVAGWKPPPRDGRRDPIFVVGFPRAGTTLIEQMLAAHPNLVVTDELPLLQTVKDATVSGLRMRQPYPQSLNVLGDKQVAILRDAYFDEAQRWLGDAAMQRRIVDKSPLNTVDLCLVRRLFPDARVIVALRDPRDTVLSCFQQAFTQGLPHLFGFESTAQLYVSMMNLWLHYRATLGLQWMELRYEDVVAQPDARARGMIEFIGEEWNDAVLQNHASERRRYVTTPSFEDVSKPVYATSVKRWERYRPQFERVRALLEPFVREFGYGGW